MDRGNLMQRWEREKEYLPKGKFSRFSIMHCLLPLFDDLNCHHRRSANEAISQIKWYGEKTRSRWEQEYRHQRVLRSILIGTDWDYEREKYKKHLESF